jgi:hypothetical protein
MGEQNFKHLIAGRRYRLAKDLVDYDGRTHRAGGIYTFVGNSFLPYDDGLTLKFLFEGDSLRLRLQWRPEAQAEIIDHLENYFVEAGANRDN